MKKRIISAMVCATMLMTLCIGCGKSDSSQAVSESSNSKYKEFITVDVFDIQANYQGIQSGWFAKIVKDKFNMELNIISPSVSGGGDTLFQTRSAAGNLGDLIIENASDGKLEDLVSSGLIMDMSKYTKDEKNLATYQDAIDYTNKNFAKKEGTWFIPSEVSKVTGKEPQEGNDLNFGAYIRWDLYKKLGYPIMKTFNDLLPVMKQMQDASPTSDSGKKTYAFSLFKDWDNTYMNEAAQYMSYYGAIPQGFIIEKADNSEEPKSILDDDSLYMKGLKFYYDANQMGLVDPESTTQNYDTVRSKYEDGAVLFSPWPWLGQAAYNKSERKSEGKGFMLAPISDQKIYSWGTYAKGNPNCGIMIGSKAQDPQRLADFIDWLYSPEGIEDCNGQNGTSGPKGITWEIKDGKPQLTDFGKKAISDGTTKVPEENGGGTWKDGSPWLSYKTVSGIEINPETNLPYNYTLWDSYLKDSETALDKDWKQQMNATTTVDYLKKNNQVIVASGSSYAPPKETSDIATLRSQCKSVIVEYSWKAVFAKDDAEYKSMIKTMKDTVKGFGYDTVVAVDKQSSAEREKARH